eukprot:Rhum_TRINITY_DN15042_c30_g1::Rhum_TRINITY_DN15042_c30_g1_i1::g.137205::m.137205
MDLPLFVRDLEGSVHPVAVSVSSTVEEIFEQLQGIVATDGCDLLLEGVPLSRTDEVAETGVAPDDVLQLTSKKLRLTWQVYDGDNSAAELLEDGTAVVNRNQTTKNWDAHTAPLIPLARTGTSFSFVVQCLYEPSWTTSIGVTAEGLRAGRGSTEMAQLSIGEKGAVQWDSEELLEYLVTVGSVLEFQVDAVPHAGSGAAAAAAGEDSGEDRRMQVEVNVYVHTEGRRVHGKAITFLTEAKHVHLSCYCYAPGQGWRIVNNLESLRAA